MTRTNFPFAEKFKEENWNLEVTLQELRARLSESRASIQRLESEQKRLTKLLAAKHETDAAQTLKTDAGPDKSDLEHSEEESWTLVQQ